jgi:uracil DNA glycosylase
MKYCRNSIHFWLCRATASNGFFGSRPFSKINAALREAGKPEIDWQVPE